MIETEPVGIIRPAVYPIPLIGFAAYSGTGKTTLLTKLLPLLKAYGLRVAVIKHAHHSFELDQSGKDSMRLRQSGADPMLIASRQRTAFIKEHRDNRAEPRLSEALAMICTKQVDLVLVEGFKHEPIPKIELHRCALRKPFLYLQDPNIIAVASDCELPPEHSERLAHFSLDDVEKIADFIVASFITTAKNSGQKTQP
jgi:molybdopterin-guanine dinucleotide biosynthesis protein B